VSRPLRASKFMASTLIAGAGPAGTRRCNSAFVEGQLALAAGQAVAELLPELGDESFRRPTLLGWRASTTAWS